MRVDGRARGVAAAAALVALASARPARPGPLAERQLDSVERAQAMVVPKLDNRRRDWLHTLAAAYRLVRPEPARPWTDHRSPATRTWRRAWLRQLVRIKKRELAALSGELALLHAARDRAGRASRAPDPTLSQDLTWPVSGSVVRHPGRYRHASGAILERRGIELSTHPGEAVLAPLAGTVRYCGDIGGLGPSLVIMSDAGESVTLGRARAGLAAGAQVVAGQRVATAAADRLYMEVRVGPAGGRPVDPVPHLRSR